jgi:2-amino-4-hydroxy-6-hydroxymethyldihydropteridine diphosphokinase
MALALIGLGSNLGDRRALLRQALAAIDDHAELQLRETSTLRETPPAGGPPGQDPFLNAAATVETALEPAALLSVLQRIEDDLGRRRTQRWGPRTVDLDLLLYDDVVAEGPELVLPHPRMAWRRFVLEPAAEVAAAMLHPTTGRTVGQLLAHLNRTPFYVALAGPIGVGKTHLAARLAETAGAERIDERVDTCRLQRFYADPSGSAWQVEIEFLRQRARLLAADRPGWSHRDRVAVSDFWFEQSLAFAGVWLPPSRLAEFEKLYDQASRNVVEPRLIVLLDAPVERLLERIRRRGRPGEGTLAADVLQRIRDAILARARRPGVGPVLRVASEEPAAMLAEVVAAVESIK